MPLALVLVVLGALATARATRLLVVDRLTRGVRQAVLRRWPGPSDEVSLPGYLVHCPWCVSIWFGAPIAAAVVAAAPALRPDALTGIVVGLLLWLTYSQVSGMLAGFGLDD